MKYILPSRLVHCSLPKRPRSSQKLDQSHSGFTFTTKIQQLLVVCHRLQLICTGSRFNASRPTAPYVYLGSSEINANHRLGEYSTMLTCECSPFTTQTCTLPKTNSSPLKSYRAPKGNNRIPTIHFQVRTCCKHVREAKHATCQLVMNLIQMLRTKII